MTIPTNILDEEKKQEQLLDVPLVKENELNNAKAKKEGELKAAYIDVPDADFLISRDDKNGGPEFSPQGSILVLFLTALFLMGMGIVGGLLIYNQFARMQIHRMTGCCKIPYDGPREGFFMINSLGPECDSAFDMKDRIFGTPQQSYFLEQFEIDPFNGNYEKIDVPNFTDGKRGRFIHDFNSNKTGIIDLDGKRCFVMPLDQSHVLPPRSLLDLVEKMSSGYYDVNMTAIQQKMKVVLPPIQDFTNVGMYISKDCSIMPTYKLEPFEGKVVKRSADIPNIIFTHFSGNNIQQFNIVNLDEVHKYEELLKDA